MELSRPLSREMELNQPTPRLPSTVLPSSLGVSPTIHDGSKKKQPIFIVNIKRETSRERREGQVSQMHTGPAAGAQPFQDTIFPTDQNLEAPPGREAPEPEGLQPATARTRPLWSAGWLPLARAEGGVYITML